MFRVFGSKKRKNPDVEWRVQQVQMTGSPEQRNDLLQDLEPQVLKIASKISRRLITKHDDEYIVALGGLDEAISKYDEHQQSSFMSFAYMVIHGRLVDYFRKQKKHMNQVPLTNSFADEEELDHPGVIAQATENFREAELAKMRQLEITIFSKTLAEHGITMHDLIAKSPKHRDTRENLLQIAQALVSHRSLLQDFYARKRLKKHIIEGLGLQRRTLSRHRIYLTALTILFMQDLPLMREYLDL
jgi:RNA polymerase sigma factor